MAPGHRIRFADGPCSRSMCCGTFMDEGCSGCVNYMNGSAGEFKKTNHGPECASDRSPLPDFA
ncbi:hypothetical protein BMJ34_28700 [Sinorhizobium medicae]|uniref:DUF1289 domain-containing protein n=1 Tax=Sinorhizobium medicae TaxID=110321 RepID=A0ABX4TIR4_9HYPH|nr:hypothetical protein BMJ34_28700 [Sinorhizobium medicae]PLT93243.1 hypothetical protein BMJ35_04420 [Sinorhizobium medicae]PLU00554.1 hypothetical protein BMJ33_20555 [Sinorhizobium medicae]PLU14236.1 hypothetical protein BMJ29_28015 [Sinorhizobium medicae]PLU21777.1 hypothetical protein BMJ30_05625 [Sinorhizobium medicae]